MELNNWKTYLAITIIGVTIGVLFLAINGNLPTALMVFFITLYLVVALKFLLERHHYKKHNSVLASTQFLLLPYVVLLMGNYISPIALTVDIYVISVNSTDVFFLNLISISLIIPVIILSLLFSKYYSNRWPAMAINRKIKRGRKFPFLFHSLFIITFLIGFFINWQIDFVCFIFVILYFIYIFRYFIIVAINKSRKEVRVSARTTTRASSTRSTSASQRRGQVPVTSRSGQRSVSARSTSTASSSRRSGSVARVDRGIDVTTASRKTVKRTTTTTTVSKSIFPIGTPKKEEMKCIICYMDFDKKDTRRIILCPHCKYPAHEDEFLNWFNKSRLCARCNQPISTKYVNNPKYRISIKVYIEKVIEKL